MITLHIFNSNSNAEQCPLVYIVYAQKLTKIRDQSKAFDCILHILLIAKSRVFSFDKKSLALISGCILRTENKETRLGQLC